MRILHLVARSHRRGAELVALELAQELDALGHANRVLALVSAEHGSEEDPQLPPLVSHSRIGARTRVLCTWRLRRIVRAEHYDVVLAHGGWPAQVAALCLDRGGPLLVWQRILGFPAGLWRGPRRRLWRVIAARVDAAVALTSSDEVELRALGFAGPVWVIPNFRRPERFLRTDRVVAAGSLRRELGIDADVPLLGFVGHLVEQKRPERTLDVLSEVHRRGQCAHLVIAGDGPLRADLEDRVRERGLATSVSLLGHRDDVELIFGGVDVSLLTSDAEGMPGVAIEAQMAGCPLVAFPVGGVDEVVEHGVTGMILDRHDTSLMAGEVVRILGDPVVRAEMSSAARGRAARFGASHSAVTYEARLEAHLDRTTRVDQSSAGPGRRRGAPPLEDRLPNLFIAGAPKAGTTFVHQALRLAENTYMSEVKEPGFFISREHRLGLEHYAGAYFHGAHGHMTRGESTPWYLYSEEALQRIAALPLSAPPKVLVLVRRPADRALSMFRDQKRRSPGPRSFAEAVADELRGLERGELAEDVRQRFVWCGHYTTHIRRWQEVLGPESVEVVVFEDLAATPDAVWAHLGAFLAHDLGPPSFDQVSERDRNPAGDLRWPRLDRALRSLEGRDHLVVERAKAILPPGTHRRALQKLGRINRQPGTARALDVDHEVLAMLDEHYREEHRSIEALIGRPIDAWSRARTAATDGSGRS